MTLLVFDTESDGLLDEATRFWVFGWTFDGKDYHVTESPEEFMKVLDSVDYAVCHNCIRFDFPLLKKLHNYTFTGVKIDTLALSWYTNPNRPKHGLEAIGEEHGVKKVEVASELWKTGDIPLMKERVVEDVKINWLEWKKQEKTLRGLYG